MSAVSKVDQLAALKGWSKALRISPSNILKMPEDELYERINIFKGRLRDKIVQRIRSSKGSVAPNRSGNSTDIDECSDKNRVRGGANANIWDILCQAALDVEEMYGEEANVSNRSDDHSYMRFDPLMASSPKRINISTTQDITRTMSEKSFEESKYETYYEESPDSTAIHATSRTFIKADVTTPSANGGYDMSDSSRQNVTFEDLCANRPQRIMQRTYTADHSPRYMPDATFISGVSSQYTPSTLPSPPRTFLESTRISDRGPSEASPFRGPVSQYSRQGPLQSSLIGSSRPTYRGAWSPVQDPRITSGMPSPMPPRTMRYQSPRVTSSTRYVPSVQSPGISSTARYPVPGPRFDQAIQSPTVGTTNPNRFYQETPQRRTRSISPRRRLQYNEIGSTTICPPRR